MVAAAIWAFVLCFLVVADVSGRVLFNSPVKGTPEIISLSIVIICFLQAGYAIRSGGMLNVDTLVTHLSPRAQSLLAAWGALIGVFFFWPDLLRHDRWCGPCLELWRVRGRGCIARTGLAGQIHHLAGHGLGLPELYLVDVAKHRQRH